MRKIGRTVIASAAKQSRPQWVMAGLDPAIQSHIAALHFLPWMAASILGSSPRTWGGHDELWVILPWIATAAKEPTPDLIGGRLAMTPNPIKGTMQ